MNKLKIFKDIFKIFIKIFKYLQSLIIKHRRRFFMSFEDFVKILAIA